jgi:gas vesicle protein GvpL/GvpF
MTLTYVYCLVRSAKAPLLRDVPGGMPGAGVVRALAAGGGLWAVVSSVPASEYDEAALARGLQDLDWVGRRGMAHESVVEHFLTARAVLPMQLFTLFTSDDRALEYVAGERRRIDRILSRLERQLEWGLRLSFDEQAARAAVEETHRSRRGRSRRTESGAAYLARKRDLFDVTRVQLTQAKTAADRLYRAMSRQATDSRRRAATEQATPGSRLLLDAAFLVPTGRAGAFRTALRQNASKLSGSGLVVSLTGPWPAYNFVDSAARRRTSRTRRATTSSRAGRSAR